MSAAARRAKNRNPDAGCFGGAGPPCTVTGMLHTCGAGFQDWSAVYRLFSKARLDVDSFFAVTRRGVVRELDPAGEVDRMEMLPL